MRMRKGWSTAVRPVLVGMASAGLILGVLGSGSGLAGAEAHAKSVYRFETYVGGHGKANSKLSPVTIGVVNQQTATDAIAPDWTTGAKLAVEYMNQHTDGIDGHPVKISLCKIATTVATASKCGQQFADDSSVSAVAAGAIDVGNTALETALGPSKKPIIFGISFSATDEKDPDGFILWGDVTHVTAPMATFAKKVLHVKSVSLVYPENIPASVSSADIIDSALHYEGVKDVYKVGFTSANTNLSEPLEAAHVGATSLLISENNGGPSCSDTALTLKSLAISTKVLVNVPCDTPTIAKADGGQLPAGWYYSSASPVPGSPTKVVAAFDQVATEYGRPTTGPNVHVSEGFGELLTIAKFDTEILKAGRAITPKSVMAKAKAFKGPVVFGAPHLDCGGFAGFPAVCNDLVQVYQNTSPHVMKKAASWIGPPRGFKVTLST